MYLRLSNKRELDVLILLLMEYPFWADPWWVHGGQVLLVLILLLMEYPFWVQCSVSIIIQSTRLNPSSNGIPVLGRDNQDEFEPDFMS